MLSEAGWEPGAVEDLSADYARWYARFVERISKSAPRSKTSAAPTAYDFVLTMYSGLHGAIASGAIGGAIVNARAR